MRKSLKIICFAFLSFVFLTCFSGCAKDGSNSLVGSWKHSSYVYTFKNDKSGSYKSGDKEMKFTYTDDGKKVSILYDGNTTAGEYEYKIEGNKLIIKDSFGSDVEYTRK